ncbi:MAG: ADP-glyceromanno-heptose 6-epimerase [Verrucomicrobiales bacterium]|jgi:ADP-L-glycero-D-manno-heptose 6-epimerase|nr:ADP-glyceromanno-heptose 6-epimerase [Verrucomicrobiales bacterium]
MKDLIIVTGAAGFIGRNIVAMLNERGHDNLLLVDFLGTDEKWQNLVGLRYEDVLPPPRLLDLILSGKLSGVRAIIHEGACSATTEKNADYLLENNYRYTRQLCEWALANDARFVYASSAATYGDGSLGYSDADSVTEQLRPLNMYGYSKHMFDLWALRNGLLDKIAGLKYFNVYGPYEDHKGEMRSLVHKAYHQIKTRGYIELFKSDRPEYADGEQRRDFVYVRDAAKVTLHFALDSQAGGLFNCGAGQARTWLDLANALFAAMGRQPDIRFIDMPAILKGKYQYFTQADAKKLQTQGGYTTPFASVEEGVADYVKTYLARG